ncbi:hypothetical protein D3C73_1365930 [compost metagenome]
MRVGRIADGLQIADDTQSQHSCNGCHAPGNNQRSDAAAEPPHVQRSTVNGQRRQQGEDENVHQRTGWNHSLDQRLDQ